MGRIAGIIDHHYVEFHQEKVGFFGFFESIPDAEVAETLLSKRRRLAQGAWDGEDGRTDESLHQ